MSALLRLRNVWNLLPVFQVVAETDQLSTAARCLDVAPSTLPGTIRLLEDALGHALFDGAAGTIRLNANGQRLLTCIQRATEALDAGLTALPASGLARPTHLSASGILAQALTVPALRELREQNAAILPRVYAEGLADVAELLRSGRLDVSLSENPVEAAGLESTRLGEGSVGVYCGRAHPLFNRGAPSSAEVIAHPFVCCSPRAGVPPESVPGDEERHDAILVGQLEVAIDICIEGRLLAILPDCAVRAEVSYGVLRRLAVPGLPSVPLYATFARTEGATRRAAPVVAAVRAALARALARGLDAESPRSARCLLGPPPPPEAWLAPAEALFLRAEYDAARLAYEQARAQRGAEGRLSPLDNTLYAQRMAQMAIVRGQYAEAEDGCVGALRGLGASEPILRAMLAATASLACGFQGNDARAEEWLEDARAHASAWEARAADLDGVWARGRMLVFRAEGNHFLARGRARAAAAAYERGYRVCAATGDAWERSIALFNMAEAWGRAGDLERAEALLDEAAREKSDIGDRWGSAYVHGVRAGILMLRQDRSSAARDLDLGRKLASTLDDPRLRSLLDVTGLRLGASGAPGDVVAPGSAAGGNEGGATFPRATSSARAMVAPTFALRREGEYFTIEHAGKTTCLKVSIGLELLARLIESAGRELPAIALAASGSDLPLGNAGEMLDARAIAAYKRRLEDVQDQLTEAEEMGDPGRATRARQEIDALATELARGIGLGGRARVAGSASERARVNVQRHLRKAIRKIAQDLPELGRYLEWTVKTGTFCVYQPPD
ncbi:MAG: LysR family transcriptional regulator [Byssovorax sp.]